ncbi:MAG: hypothetical protein ACREUU_17790, partial [Gammaproteobacteria bacterium]
MWIPQSGGWGMAGGYFWLGAYVLAGLVFGGLCASRAVAKGRPAVGWFFAGLFLLAPAYMMLVLTKGDEPARGGTLPPLRCAGCGRL